MLLYLRSSTKLDYYTGQTTTSRVTWTIPSIADGAWHQITLVRDPVAGHVSLYLDGQLVANRDATLSALSIDDGGFLLGQEQDSVGGGFSASQAFNGVMDDVRLYSRVLTPQEIAALAGAQ